MKVGEVWNQFQPYDGAAVTVVGALAVGFAGIGEPPGSVAGGVVFVAAWLVALCGIAALGISAIWLSLDALGSRLAVYGASALGSVAATLIGFEFDVLNGDSASAFTVAGLELGLSLAAAVCLLGTAYRANRWQNHRTEEIIEDVLDENGSS